MTVKPGSLIGSCGISLTSKHLQPFCIPPSPGAVESTACEDGGPIVFHTAPGGTGTLNKWVAVDSGGILGLGALPKFHRSVAVQASGPYPIQSGSYLSTGWFTLILAMDMCKEIRVYGMINETYCKSEGYRKVPYHYYESGSRDECAEYLLHESAPYGGHRFITEKAVFAKWAKTRPIKFRYPDWPLL
ncbi:hypothetical protein NFI96_000392 [Prochilodus magdalenae]|nr:hypothetical protein NFI96_000392 [Prochilodus magdalenae]